MGVFAVFLSLTMKNFYALGFIVALVALCNLSNGEVADVQFFHGVAGAPNVDLYLDGTLVVSNLPFGESTGYLQVSFTSGILEVRATGASEALATDEVSLGTFDFYTIAVVGSLNNLEEYPLQFYVTEDQTFTSGRSELRVLNLVPGSPVLRVEANGAAIFSGGYSAQDVDDIDVSTYQELSPFVPYRVVLFQGAMVVAGPTIVDLVAQSTNTLFIIGTVDGTFPFITLELTQDYVEGQTSNSISPTGSTSISRTPSRSVSPTRSFNSTATPSPTISFSRSLSTLPTRTPFRTFVEDDDDGGFTRAPSPSPINRRSATIVRTRNPSPLVEPPYDYLTSNELYLDDDDDSGFISSSPLPRPSPFLSRTIRFVTESDNTLTLVVPGDDDDSVNSGVALSLSLALTFVVALIVLLH